MTGRPRRSFRLAAQSPTVVGWLLVLAGLIGMYLAFNASRGFPFASKYTVAVDVPDAAEITAGTSEVRIGGARVGLVEEAKAMPGRRGRPAFARLTLALEDDVEELPVDTVVEVRHRSILGAKYLDLRPGDSSRGLAQGAVLPLAQARVATEFDEAFTAFDIPTRRNLRASLTALGDGLAGRGEAVNRTIGTLRTLVPRTERVAAALEDPRTELEGLVRGTDAAMGALAQVAPELGSAVAHGDTTLAALDASGDSLGRTISELAPTEEVGTRAALRLRPVLDDLGAITGEIRPAVRKLPPAARGLAGALGEGVPLLRSLNAPYALRAGAPRTSVRAQFGRALGAVEGLARDPATRASLVGLTATLRALRPTLDVLAPAQLRCNLLGLWTRNIGGIVQPADRTGNWINVLLLVDIDTNGQHLQSPDPDPKLHANYRPNLNESECEAGNEEYSSGQRIGNPPGLQRGSTEETSPPAGVRDLAREAGLLGRPRGARP